MSLDCSSSQPWPGHPVPVLLSPQSSVLSTAGTEACGGADWQQQDPQEPGLPVCWRKQPLKCAVGRDDVLLPHHGWHQSQGNAVTHGPDLTVTTPGRERAGWGGQAAETRHPTAQGRMPTGPPRTSSVYLRIPPISNTQHECCGNPVPHPSGLGSLTPGGAVLSITARSMAAMGHMEELCLFPGTAVTAGMRHGDQPQLCQAGTQGCRSPVPQGSQHSHASLGAPSRACHQSLALILCLGTSAPAQL